MYSIAILYSFPDLGLQVKSAEKQECEAVDLTLSSDTEDVVEMLQEQPEESLSPPVYKGQLCVAMNSN